MTDIQDKPHTGEMAKAYSHHAVEARWYDWWQAQGYFTPERDPDKEPYTIIMPPPNVTGRLHMGHALTNAVEDILIRWKRMTGYATLYLPGEDHAGIAGQLVVEKELAAEGKSRHDLGREEFVARVGTARELTALERSDLEDGLGGADGKGMSIGGAGMAAPPLAVGRRCRVRRQSVRCRARGSRSRTAWRRSRRAASLGATSCPTAARSRGA